MLFIGTEGEHTQTSRSAEQEEGIQRTYWRDAAVMFGVSNMSAVVATTHFLQTEMEGILQDAIAGHCQPELTCKKDSLQKLQELLRVQREERKKKNKQK